MWRKRSGADSAAPAEPAGPGVMQTLEALLRDLPGLVSDRVSLLALELKRAGVALAQIVAWLIGLAVLLVTAWLTTWVAVAVAALHAGVPWGWVVAGVLLVNLGVAWLGVLRVKALAACLTLPATTRRLTIASQGDAAGDRPAAAHALADTVSTAAASVR